MGENEPNSVVVLQSNDLNEVGRFVDSVIQRLLDSKKMKYWEQTAQTFSYDALWSAFNSSVKSEARKIENYRVETIPVPDKITSNPLHVEAEAYRITAAVTPKWETKGGRVRDVSFDLVVHLKRIDPTSRKPSYVQRWEIFPVADEAGKLEEKRVAEERKESGARARSVLSGALKRRPASAGAPGLGKKRH